MTQTIHQNRSDWHVAINQLLELDTGLSPRQIKQMCEVLHKILSLSKGRTNGWRGSRKLLARFNECSDKTVMKRIQLAESFGLLKVTRRHRAVNRYQINYERIVELLNHGSFDTNCETNDVQIGLQQKYQQDLLRTMPYSQYLASEHWQTLRRLALEYAEHRCQICNGEDNSLHVHHRTYDRFGAERLSDLTVLCDICHKIFHKHGRLYQGKRSR